MDNSLLAVRDINHKNIVVERGTLCGRLGQALRSGAYAGFREGQLTLVNIAEVSD